MFEHITVTIGTGAFCPTMHIQCRSQTHAGPAQVEPFTQSVQVATPHAHSSSDPACTQRRGILPAKLEVGVEGGPLF